VSAAFGPEAGNGTERRQRSRAELEMEAGRLAAERRAGRHRAQRAEEPTKANGAALVGSGDTVEGLVAAPAKQAQVTRGLPPEVLKAFATVPDHLKGEACRGELGVGADPTPGAHPPTAGNPEGSCSGAAFDGAAALPQFIRPNFERMPPELKLLKNWVLWAAIWKGSKWTKRPVQVSGFGASTTNPKHWSSFDDVKQAYERITAAGGYLELREKGKTQKVLIGGVGFVFDGQPDQDRLVFAGVDFDGVMSQQTIASSAAERVKRLRSYTEASVSGTGLHVILKARPLSSGVAHAGVELYTSGRFFTMTGGGSTPIAAAPDAFAALADELAQSARATPSRSSPPRVSAAASNFPPVPPHLQGLSGVGELGAGIEPRDWFKLLPPEKQSDLVRASLDKLDNRTSDPRKRWLDVVFAVADAERLGCPDAHDLALEWSRRGASWTSEADFEVARRSYKAKPGGITIGTLLRMAKEAGLDLSPWRELALAAWRGATGATAGETSAGTDYSFADPWSVEVNPVAALMALRDQGADIQSVLLAMNRTFAVVKYGSNVMVATIIGKEVDFMKLTDFHNMLANLVVWQEIEMKDDSGNPIKDDSGNPKKTTRSIIVSKRWLKWNHRRQYLGRGVVFEPGGPLEIPTDTLNLWRGFGIEPKQGDWSVMLNHIRDVICSGNKNHFQYLIRWMAYGVQHPDRPIGVAIALRGEEGAGKGFVWRNYGKLFGKHFKHVAHGEHLTGRFNAALAEACTVFLDEALWAGDRKGEQILKALVTEDTFQLERKFCDPIPVKNRLRIVIASNNQWIVPVSTRGRRYCVLDVSDQYADENDPAHAAYWEPLQAQFGDYAPDEGRAAMLYDLLQMDLSNFNIRAVPKSAAKTEQKLLTQTGTEAWLFEILQDGAVTKSSQGFRHTISKWDGTGMQISRDEAYDAFLQSSQERREYKPRSKEWWSRDLRKILKDCVSDERPRKDNPNRNRFLIFGPLNECRNAYGEFAHADDIDWEPLDEPNADSASLRSDADETKAEADVEWEPVDEPNTDEADSGPVQVMPGPQ
jgi:Family of unknown function (DUF5906)/Primase C terminal 2 (PriCT-2)